MKGYCKEPEANGHMIGSNGTYYTNYLLQSHIYYIQMIDIIFLLRIIYLRKECKKS
jgi:hypothetical protein